MKKAIITGITGQDGCYLAKLLLDKGYKVYGAQRRNTGKRYWRLDELGIRDDIEIVDIDLTEDDIAGLVGSLDNLATKDGDVYTLNDDVFTPPNKPPSPNKSVNIIVS